MSDLTETTPQKTNNNRIVKTNNYNYPENVMPPPVPLDDNNEDPNAGWYNTRKANPRTLSNNRSSKRLKINRLSGVNPPASIKKTRKIINNKNLEGDGPKIDNIIKDNPIINIKTVDKIPDTTASLLGLKITDTRKRKKVKNNNHSILTQNKLDITTPLQGPTLSDTKPERLRKVIRRGTLRADTRKRIKRYNEQSLAKTSDQ